MSFKDIELKIELFSPKDNIVNDFFIPCLKNAESYDRAAGYFTSYSLVDASIGICDMAKRGKKIRLLTSPRLNEEDVNAIREGYDLKTTIDAAMVRDFERPSDITYEKRLSFLADLISSGLLEIKVVVMKDIKDYPDALFHAKFGIITDSDRNIISFSGSANSTRNALGGNWDHISISRSWIEPERVSILSNQFNDIWNNKDPTTITIEMPQAISAIIRSYRTKEGQFNLDEELINNSKKESIFFKKPDYITLRDYQKTAIDNWKNNNYQGYFDMATGTGKTITALCSLEKLYNDTGGGLVTVIVCPQKHLVDQWAEAAEQFNVMPIIGYSDPSTSGWKNNFKRKILSFNENNNICLITTINSFVSDDIQEWFEMIGKRLVLVIDEAHNMGSNARINKLPDYIQYRLGLSATITRYNDKTGTKSLKEFFKKECMKYTLEEAIKTGMLTNYEYHPIICEMSSEEYSSFIDINESIEKITNSDIDDNIKRKKIKELKIQGSTIVAGLQSKFNSLYDLGKKLKGETHILTYCGKARWNNELIDSKSEKECIRLIDKAVQILGHNGVGLTVSKFTYLETVEERRSIKRDFTNGSIDSIIAISCLDEGVDIPSIKTAIITSSSNNPKEYIQRRGRDLRKFPGKNYAVIYDMIAIPKPLSGNNSNNRAKEIELKHIVKEISRIQEFSKICLNPSESVLLLEQIEDSYEIKISDILELYSEVDEEYD